MLRECTYGECAHEQHVRRILTITHHCLLSVNVVHVHIHVHMCRVERVYRKQRPPFSCMLIIHGNAYTSKEVSEADRLNVFIMTSDKLQMKLQWMCT